MNRILFGLGLLAFGVPSPLGAQGRSLQDRLADLFTFGVCGRPLCLDGSVSAANGHGDHFLPDLAAGNAAVITFLSDAIAAATGTVPITASAGGVTYRFVGGLPVKTSESVGPIFAERAQTLGRGRLLLGARFATANLRTLRGVPLDRLELNFTHQDVGRPGLGDPLLENDVLETQLALHVGLDVTSVVATYGLTDRLDLSVAVPLVHTSLQARSVAQVHPFGATAVHFFAGTPEQPGLRATAATFGSATGLGDIAIRAKASLMTREHFALGFLADARLPTGDEANFAGAGALGFRALMIGSARFGDFAPHLNVGYQVRGGAGRNDALVVNGGFDQPAGDWATVAVEVVSEWQVSANGTELPSTVQFRFPFTRTVEPTNIPNSRDHRVLGSFGAKFRTSDGGPILLLNALVPIQRGGMQPAVMWTAGLDFGF